MFFWELIRDSFIEVIREPPIEENGKQLNKQAKRKASWNNMGVEPGNQEGPGC